MFQAERLPGTRTRYCSRARLHLLLPVPPASAISHHNNRLSPPAHRAKNRSMSFLNKPSTADSGRRTKRGLDRLQEESSDSGTRAGSRSSFLRKVSAQQTDSLCDN